MKGFEAAEKAFLELAIGGPNREFDRSGSCCLVVLIVGIISIHTVVSNSTKVKCAMWLMLEIVVL